ncbi:MAG: hypothetical protein RMK29_16165 [Myxococcales bacterium]|nr:hypothetical protein [Myxococcota bacterium]MDW8283252.1 hypothetical protein [Myxococcales bacterium]
MRTESAPGFRTYTRAIDVLDRVADPRLVARLLRHLQVDLVPPPEHYVLPQALRPMRILCDPARMYAGYLGVRAEVEIPMELRRDLHELVPQALLRDIHRMEYVTDEEARWQPVELGLDPAGQSAMAEIRAALVREPVPVVEPLVEAVRAEQARRRRFLQEPWQPVLPDDFPRNYREIPG